jgi:tryptophanyl-tRNA synthetase
MPKPILISGIQPSGTLHIGNYIGALQNFVTLQNSGKYTCFFFIADLHALTGSFTAKKLSTNITNLAITMLAAGLNPKKSTLYIQSHIPEHTELAWIFNCLAPVGEMERMVEYKEKITQGISSSMGLLGYPTLMAADILLYKAHTIPVGDDQRQHLELTRTIARKFNKKFGSTFPEPKPLHTKTPRVMSLSDPAKKMSKSMPNGCLFLTDPPKKIKEKITRAVTDSESRVGYDPKSRPGISNLIDIYTAFSSSGHPERAEGEPKDLTIKQFHNKGYSEFKADLANLLIEKLKPFQTKYKELSKKKELIARAFGSGSQKTRKTALITMEEVKKKTGLA